MRLIRHVALIDEDDDDASEPAASLWSWYELPRAADNDGSRTASRPVLLDVHSRDVERAAMRIVEGLSLDQWLKQAVIAAALSRSHFIPGRLIRNVSVLQVASVGPEPISHPSPRARA